MEIRARVNARQLVYQVWWNNRHWTHTLNLMTRRCHFGSSYGLTRNCSTGMHFQGLQQAVRWLRKNGKSTTIVSQRLRNIDVAANIVRNFTQVSSDAYSNDIISHVTQTRLVPRPAPVDETVCTATNAATTVQPYCLTSWNLRLPVVQVVQVPQARIIEKIVETPESFFLFSNC